ncbi:MAG: hypothetical protein ACFE9D_06220 [Promethearchaeota archaeon]
MSDETASTLILVGAILQLLFSLALIGFGVVAFILPLLFGYIDIWILIVPAFFFIGGIISLIFTILWFQWRHEPAAHKTALIITGILGLLFGGFLPGLLVLIGGAVAEGSSA